MPACSGDSNHIGEIEYRMGRFVYCNDNEREFELAKKGDGENDSDYGDYDDEDAEEDI